EHALRAVEKREAFFGFKCDRCDFSVPESFSAGKYFAVKFGRALSNDDVREMRERREVAGGSNRSLRGNHGMDTGVEHRAQGFDGTGADATESFGERVGTKQHHGAGFGYGQRFADSAGV